MNRSLACSRLFPLLVLFALCFLCVLREARAEPRRVPEALDWLKAQGLTNGEYGIADELERLRDEEVPPDDTRWEQAWLRYAAVRMGDGIGKIRKSDERPEGHKKKLTEQQRLELLRDLAGELGETGINLLEEIENAPDEAARAEALEALFTEGERRAAVHMRIAQVDAESLRLAITDLMETWPEEYAEGQAWLEELPGIEQTLATAREQLLDHDPAGFEKAEKVFAFQQKALLSNPLLRGKELLLVKRHQSTSPRPWQTYGSAHVLHSMEADNEIALLPEPSPEAEPRTVFRPEKREFVGHVDLHWDAERLIFTKQGSLFEMGVDGSNPRRLITGQPDWLDNFDACYLPDDGIIFSSTAGAKGVPCGNGKGPTQSLFLLKPDGETIRRLTFDQDHSWHPVVMNDGRVLYTRWDYTDAHHYYARLLMAMNPDGTAQFSIFGTNSYFPNGKFFTRQIPWRNNRFITTEVGHVEPIGRAGRLMLIDLSQGQGGPEGVVQVIPHREAPIETTLNYVPIRDFSAPRYKTPWPLADAESDIGTGKYFLTACKLNAASPYGIYLVDVFDNQVLVQADREYDLLEPIPVSPRPRPPVIPDRVDPEKDTATVHLLDVYVGDGLKNVPRGTVKELRVYAYHFNYLGLGGHLELAINGPWDARRILGTVPVEKDGSAFFKVPANLPIAVQPLDEDGAALQIMRSWYTGMSGERASCIGCHEQMSTVPNPSAGNLALMKGANDIQPWYGPARPFSYEREVQPVLDKYCVSCHNGEGFEKNPLVFDLRSREDGNEMPADMVHDFEFEERRYPSTAHFPPSYRILQRYVRRPAMESDYILRNPGEYHANTAPLIQMLRKGHHGVRLDEEAYDRLITWIDLNVPCFGTWTEVAETKPNPEKPLQVVQEGHAERMECDRLYGGPNFDPEAYPEFEWDFGDPVKPEPVEKPTQTVSCEGWPMGPEAARAEQEQAGEAVTRTIEMPGGGEIGLKLIPAGRFVMGDASGHPDEWPLHVSEIAEPFWMADREITNAQFAVFQPEHESGFFDNLGKNNEGRGTPLNHPEQPVVRVSWQEARAYCEWLSEQTGLTVRLPTETEWEYACRAGSDQPLNYGGLDADFSRHENLADIALHKQKLFFPVKPWSDAATWMRYYSTPFSLEPRFDDQQTVPTAPGTYQANAWGLHDMHGNVQEWTGSAYEAYPGNASGAAAFDAGQRVARGGSWCDRPRDARAGIRRAYPDWQRVHNVGFRVVVEP